MNLRNMTLQEQEALPLKRCSESLSLLSFNIATFHAKALLRKSLANLAWQNSYVHFDFLLQSFYYYGCDAVSS